MTTPSARSDVIKKQTSNDIIPVQDSTPVRRRAVEKRRGGRKEGVPKVPYVLVVNVRSWVIITSCSSCSLGVVVVVEHIGH